MWQAAARLFCVLQPRPLFVQQQGVSGPVLLTLLWDHSDTYAAAKE